MRSKAYPIALGGMLAAAAVVLMSIGTIIPVATYAAPVLCMVLGRTVLKICGSRIAWAWYGAVAILSVLLAPDKEAFRRSEDKAYIEAFGQAVAKMTMYGNTDLDPDTFNGLDIRHRIMGVNTVTAQGYTTTDAGGTTASSMTSAFLVEWGDRATTGIYPREARNPPICK